METMNKFKVGDEIVRVNTKAGWAHIGYTATVLEGHQYLGKDFCVKRIFGHQWELVQEAAKPKWTIYNNTLPWGRLTNVKKGELLLAAHAKIKFTCNKLDVYGDVAFNNEGGIYNAQYIEPVKPEPTMEELFVADWVESSTGDLHKFADRMIVKGWTK
jgi:hypothetical protein